MPGRCVPGARRCAPDLQIAARMRAKVTKAAKPFLQWYETLFSERDNSIAWSSDRLEYAFSVATRTQRWRMHAHRAGILRRPSRLGGLQHQRRSLDGRRHDNAIQPTTTTVIPAPVNFRGAPAARFWEFEDAQVDYGRIPTGPADLPQMLLIEFANSFGNDWFVIPVELDIGSLCRTRSLVVTDTFGVRTLIKSNSESGLPHSTWRMFQLSFQRPSTFSAARPCAEPVLPAAGARQEHRGQARRRSSSSCATRWPTWLGAWSA
jgi:hypothetical protein